MMIIHSVGLNNSDDNSNLETVKILLENFENATETFEKRRLFIR